MQALPMFQGVDFKCIVFSTLQNSLSSMKTGATEPVLPALVPLATNSVHGTW